MSTLSKGAADTSRWTTAGTPLLKPSSAVTVKLAGPEYPLAGLNSTERPSGLSAAVPWVAPTTW